MNIIKARQESRIIKIEKLAKALRDVKEKDIDLVKFEENLAMECSLKWGMSLRVLKEYIKLAKFKNIK